MNSDMEIQVVGFAWYKEDQYLAFRGLCEDGLNLPDSFSEWLSQAEKGVKSVSAQGKTVVKVTIDINEFPAWCRINGHNVNGKGRTSFVNHRLGVMLKNGEISV